MSYEGHINTIDHQHSIWQHTIEFNLCDVMHDNHLTVEMYDLMPTAICRLTMHAQPCMQQPAAINIQG